MEYTLGLLVLAIILWVTSTIQIQVTGPTSRKSKHNGRQENNCSWLLELDFWFT